MDIAIGETTIIQVINNNIAAMAEEGVEEMIATIMIDHLIIAPITIINPVNVAEMVMTTREMLEEVMTIGEDFTIIIEETTFMATIDMTIMEAEVGAGGTGGATDGAMMTMGETIMESRIVHRSSNQQH